MLSGEPFRYGRASAFLLLSVMLSWREQKRGISSTEKHQKWVVVAEFRRAGITSVPIEFSSPDLAYNVWPFVHVQEHPGCVLKNSAAHRASIGDWLLDAFDHMFQIVLATLSITPLPPRPGSHFIEGLAGCAIGGQRFTHLRSSGSQQAFVSCK
jgi:hypothetical protein